jgi:hypothetical protein
MTDNTHNEHNESAFELATKKPCGRVCDPWHRGAICRDMRPKLVHERNPL